MTDVSGGSTEAVTKLAEVYHTTDYWHTKNANITSKYSSWRNQFSSNLNTSQVCRIWPAYIF